MQYKRLRAMGRGGNQANLNLGMIKSFQTPRPPIDCQVRFVAHVAALQSIRQQQQEATAKAETTFHALLARAFNGDLAAALA